MSGPSERDEIAALRADLVAVLAGVILHADPYRAVARRYADAILASDWLAERDRRTAATAVREARERVMGPSEDLRDVGTCRSIANDLDAQIARIEDGNQ